MRPSRPGSGRLLRRDTVETPPHTVAMSSLTEEMEEEDFEIACRWKTAFYTQITVMVTFRDLCNVERAHYDYQFQWHLYEKEQAVVKELKQYIRDTVADDKQIALDETKSVSEWIQTLYATSRPTPEQLVRIAQVLRISHLFDERCVSLVHKMG